MKILKIILFAVLGIVLLLLLTAIFVKKDLQAEKEIIINKPKQDVFNYIVLLKNQQFYGKWNLMDLNAKKEFKGIDGTVGFVYAWQSNNKEVGKGEQEIKAIDVGNKIDYELRFLEPFKSVAESYIITETVSDNQTKVKWGFKGSINYPLNVLKLFFNMDDLIGKDFEKGLNNLKGVLEK